MSIFGWSSCSLHRRQHHQQHFPSPSSTPPSIFGIRIDLICHSRCILFSIPDRLGLTTLDLAVQKQRNSSPASVNRLPHGMHQMFSRKLNEIVEYSGHQIVWQHIFAIATTNCPVAGPASDWAIPMMYVSIGVRLLSSLANANARLLVRVLPPPPPQMLDANNNIDVCTFIADSTAANTWRCTMCPFIAISFTV